MRQNDISKKFLKKPDRKSTTTESFLYCKILPIKFFLRKPYFQFFTQRPELRVKERGKRKFFMRATKNEKPHFEA